MIYIFDDNKHGQLSANYHIDYIQYFNKKSDFVKYISSHNEYELSNLLGNAKCVLIHYSFPDVLETERIKANCKEQDIPLVVFSNQYTGTIFSNNQKKHIFEIKKDRMYFNFTHFVNHYIKQNEIELALLALGKNYELEKTLIIQDRLSIFLFKNSNNFSYYNVFKENSTEWHDLRELYLFAIPESDFDTIEEELEYVTSMEIHAKIKTLVTKIHHKNGYENSSNRR